MSWDSDVGIFSVLFLTFCTVTRVNSLDDATRACLATVETVLEHNSPELLVIPNEDEHSKFTSNKIHISVTWSHMDALFTDKSCVASYLLEYGPYNYARHKRESVLSSAHISPALNPDTTSYNIVLEDGCKVYSVHIVVIPSVSSADLVYSRPRRFWPAAYRTELVASSDSAIVTWPDSCSYVTSDWQLEACPEGQNDRCAIMRLNGESPIHLVGLQPCRIYHFRLRAQEEQRGEAGDILWSFPTARTLPKLDVDIAAGGHTSLRVTVRQGDDCDESALLHHYRVTHCTMATSSEDVMKHYYYNGGTGAGSGNGGADSDDESEDDEYYYYEEGATGENPHHTKCTNKLYTLKDGRSEFLIEGLSECTMYTVDLSPADESGQVIQPGEDYSSVHSTYCMKKGEEEQGSNFWFGDDKHTTTDITQRKSPENGGNESDDGLPIVYVSVVTIVSVLIVLLTACGISWFIRRHRGSTNVKHLRCPSEEEDASPKRSLISQTEDKSGKDSVG